jgi:predicted TIM-barrel fold metal-dependent hydrolase
MRLLLFLLCTVVASYSTAQTHPEEIRLKDFRPVSIYKVPATKIEKARYPAIDIHAHAYARSEEDLDRWVKMMDAKGIQKTIVMTGWTGSKFDSLYKAYSRYPDRFEVWCGIDYTGYQEPGWTERAIRELERCFQVGARGVGELGDKGLGELFSRPTRGYGMHVDDERLQPFFKRCGELGIPVGIHVAEPYWMYLPMDSTNDGLMNAYHWRIDLTREGILNHEQLLGTLETAVRSNPRTTFIALHLANCGYNPEMLGRLLDKYPNLYSEFGARYAEVGPIPKYMKKFSEKYQDRLLYGTDMRFSEHMYETTFRILESEDEHFYEIDLFEYHWPLYGFGLSDKALRKIYRDNARKVLWKP